MSNFAYTTWRKSSHSNGTNGACVEVGAAWRKSSYSNGPSGGCVEVGAMSRAFGVRDTKDRDGGMLVFDTTSWVSFMASVKAGRFER